jgi:UDP-N-acetylmuramate dehydrogenase
VNPQIKIKNKKLLIEFPELREYNKVGVIPAGFLISKAGLAGKRAGNAQISEKHANFIVNLGGATAENVLFLMKLAAEKVKNKFNITLEPEVQLVGFKK